MRLAVFTASSHGTDPRHATGVRTLGKLLATRGIGIVYGGGHVGLMGVLADTALADGGEVIGVMPHSLVDRELAHTGLTELHTVETMHERKALMADLSDGFVVAPGGAGTLEELFEAWTWQQLRLHGKPVALLNTAGIWDPLLELGKHLRAHGFLSEQHLDALVMDSEPETLLDRINDWKAPTGKWS